MSFVGVLIFYSVKLVSLFVLIIFWLCSLSVLVVCVVVLCSVFFGVSWNSIYFIFIVVRIEVNGELFGLKLVVKVMGILCVFRVFIGGFWILFR